MTMQERVTFRVCASRLEVTDCLQCGNIRFEPKAVNCAPRLLGIRCYMAHSYVTPCGLPGIGNVPVGLHSCHFYSDRQQLIEALVPYTVAGLQANERCLIIASPPLPAQDLVRELRQS